MQAEIEACYPSFSQINTFYCDTNENMGAVIAIYLAKAVKEDDEAFFRYLMKEKNDYPHCAFFEVILAAIAQTKRHHYLELYISLYDPENDDYEMTIRIVDCTSISDAKLLIDCLCRMKRLTVAELWQVFTDRGYVRNEYDLAICLAFEELGIDVIQYVNSNKQLQEAYYKEQV